MANEKRCFMESGQRKAGYINLVVKTIQGLRNRKKQEAEKSRYARYCKPLGKRLGFDFEMHECWFRSEYSTGFGEMHKISNTTETKQTRSLILRAYPFLISGTNGHPRANMTVTHLEVLAGKKGTIGTWSMEKSKAKHAATEDIPDAQVWPLTHFFLFPCRKKNH